jgi:hypothetical protein
MTLTIVGSPVNGALLDLPWDVPLEEWPADQLIGLPRGVSRHVVRFVRVEGTGLRRQGDRHLVAPAGVPLLQQMQRSHVPCVRTVGVIDGREGAEGRLETVLVTRHLTFSLPYRALFSQTLRPETTGRLLDALAVLLVRLHLAGYWWGTARCPTRCSGGTPAPSPPTWSTPRPPSTWSSCPTGGAGTTWPGPDQRHRRADGPAGR